MLTSPLKDLKDVTCGTVLDIKCDTCGFFFRRRRDAVECSRQTHSGEDLCRSCSASATNKKRDRAHQLKMSKASAARSRGKTIEDRLGSEKGTAFRQRCSDRSRGAKNPNFGGIFSKGFKDRPPTGKWEDRYGADKAKAMKENLSLKTSGSMNPMFGRVPSIKSSRGIRGWIDGMFFFSSYELRFILECKDRGVSIKALSNSDEYRVEYYLDGARRTYTPDFIVGGKIVEIKPSQFLSFPINILKFAAAKDKFAEAYVVISEQNISPLPAKDIILKMVEDQRLTFVANDFVRLMKTLK